MTRLLLLVVLGVGCMPAHDPNSQQLRSNDCYQCHATDYDNTSIAAATDSAIPDHGKLNTIYTTDCASCHNTITWNSHPNALFPLDKGAHAPAQCTQCHSNPDDNEGDAHGANTLCASCHPATEIVNGQTLPDGHTKHPDAIFPQNHGRDIGTWACGDCHVTMPPTTFDYYTSPPAGFNTQNFCLSCHPDGRNANGATTCAGAPCHKHRDAHHQDEDPVGCLNCHPHGSGGGG